MRSLARLAVAALALAACPAGLSDFTLQCPAPVACPPGATCLCPDGGATSAVSSAATSGSGSSGTSGSAASTAGSSGLSSGSSGTGTRSSSTGGSSATTVTSGGSTSSGGSSSGAPVPDGGPDAGDPCSAPPGTPTVVATSTFLILGLAVQGGQLYYSSFDGNMELFRVDLDGGTPTLLGSIPMTEGVSYFGNNVAANATHVYWTTDNTNFADGELAEIGLDGGSQQALATQQPGGPVSPILDATNLYWADQGTTDGGSIWKLPLAGGPAVRLASATSPYFLTLDATSVYWNTLSSGVQRVGLDGGPVSTVVGVNNAQAGVAVDSSFVYFGYASSVEALSLATGAVDILAINQIYPQALVLDGTTLYWTNSGTGLQDGSIMKLPLGCLVPIQLAGNLAAPSPVVVDATGVYWAYGSQPYQIVRLAK